MFHSDTIPIMILSRKKLLTAFAAALTLVAVPAAFTACDDAVNEHHTTYFYPQNVNGNIAYADQTVDSVRVISTDSWTLSNKVDWYDVSVAVKGGTQLNEISQTIPSGVVGSVRLDLNFKPNTTGSIRQSQLVVVSAEGKIGSVTRPVAQLPYLHILVPNVQTTTVDGKTSYTFSLKAAKNGKLLLGTGAASTESPSLIFIVYSKDATLTSSADWVVPAKTGDFATATSQTVPLTVSPNETGAERTATLTLTSAGVSSVITLTQQGA